MTFSEGKPYSNDIDDGMTRPNLLKKIAATITMGCYCWGLFLLFLLISMTIRTPSLSLF